MLIKIFLFLILNFAALAIGSIFTGKGVSSEWYTNLSRAPWTPPGWVFGVAWTTIMIAFAVYSAYALEKTSNKRSFIILYILQWVLNVSWNPVFFHYHKALEGLFIITLLLLLTGYFLIAFWPKLRHYSWCILPYFLWLIIAVSLNAWIVFKNPG